MIRVGLTGGIASGKSAVADLLAELGAVIIDADRLAREVVEPGTDGLAAIVDRFGAAVLDDHGALDRAALGRIVFADDQARRDLEAIVHPAVRRRAAGLEGAVANDAVIVQMIPLLVETGQSRGFDYCVVVDLDPGLQLDRLLRRNLQLTEAEARSRIAAQATREERLQVADFVIDNGGPEGDLRPQVALLWSRLGRVTAL